MTSVKLELQQIRHDKQRALEQGKHHLFQYLNRLERRAKRNAEKPRILERELMETGG